MDRGVVEAVYRKMDVVRSRPTGCHVGGELDVAADPPTCCVLRILGVSRQSKKIRLGRELGRSPLYAAPVHRFRIQGPVVSASSSCCYALP